MKSFQELVDDSTKHVSEIMPWDLEEKLKQDNPPLVLDVREIPEFENMHIRGSMNIPRGILEIACDYDNEKDAPELVHARKQEVVVVCGSGKRSIMAANSMQQMGYENIHSLKTGIKGWNDYDLPLLNKNGHQVDADDVSKFLSFSTTPLLFNK